MQHATRRMLYALPWLALLVLSAAEAQTDGLSSSSGEESESATATAVYGNVTHAYRYTWSVGPASTATYSSDCEADYGMSSSSTTSECWDFPDGTSWTHSVGGARSHTRTVHLNIYNDTVDEPDETIVVNFGARRGISIVNFVNRSYTYTIEDDDPTVVSLARVGSATAIDEGQKVEFTVTLGRALIAGETIDVPLSISGTNVTTGDWSLAEKSSGSLNTGVTLQDTSTATPKIRFSGAGAQTGTLELTATGDGIADPGETFNIALGPDGTGANGFDHISLGTNVGGGADPHNTNNAFSVTVNEDNTAPRITSITRQTPSTSPTNADSLTWQVTFNEAVQNVDMADFQVDGATATLAVAQVGATNAYDVTASGGNLANLDATVTLSFVSGQDIEDTSGNRLSATTPTGANDNNFVVDNSGEGGGDGPLAPVVQFSTTAYTGGEAQGSRTVNLELSVQPPFSAATTVNYQVGGSATPGEDFTALSGTVLVSGSTATIPVSILNDETEEDDETIVLTLTAAAGYTVGSQGSATIAITDDDTLPVVSVTAGDTVSEGEDATFTLTATPAPATGNPVTVNLMLSARGEVISSGETGNRPVTIDDSGTATVIISTEDDAVLQEEDGIVIARLQDGTGYVIHSNDSSASVTVRDNELAWLSVPSLTVASGDSASYAVTLAGQPMGAVTVTITPERVVSLGRSASSTVENAMGLTVTSDRLLFTRSNWNVPQEVVARVAEGAPAASLVLRHVVSGDGLSGKGDTHLPVTVDAATETVDAAPEDAEGMEAWRFRFGRTLSQQVTDALQDRFAAPPTTGLNLTVAGEAVSSPPALAENDRLLSKALGFESLTGEELLEGFSFSFSLEGEAGAPQFALWGQGAFSSFSGQEDELSLDGDVTTLLVGADWSTARWQAGAALSCSWGNGSYDGNNDADGEISSTLTGLFSYGRYALTPRLDLWATAGYGWGDLSLNPDDGEEEYEPDTIMVMVALGMDGLLLDGGSEGISLNATADLLSLNATSEDVEGLESSEGSLSRLRLGLEATRPFPLANGSSLLPSMEVGIRQDGGDAETGFGMDLGAGIAWKDPERGISGELKGRTLLSHAEEEFQDQGLALSFSWDPSPSNRGPSLSVSHAMGATATADMDALFHPAAFEQIDGATSNGQQFAAELAYGFPVHNDRLTLTPAVAMAFTPTSRNYGLLWSLAPYTEQLETDPWQFSIEAERQEQNTATSPVEHSLELNFSTLF